MSQQGADDWWQKLYEDPEAGPAPDPGDTLDNRFRSAAGVTGDPAGAPPPAPPDPVRDAAPGTGPGRGPLPSPRPEPDTGPPARPPLLDTVRPESARPPVAGPVPAPRPAPDALPASPGEGYAPPAPPAAQGTAPVARSVPPPTPAPPTAGDAPPAPPAPPAVPPAAQGSPPCVPGVPPPMSAPPVAGDAQAGLLPAPPSVPPGVPGVPPSTPAPPVPGDTPAGERAPAGDRGVPPQPPGPGLDQPAVQVPLPGGAYGPPPARAPLPGDTAGPPPAPPAAQGATTGPGFGPFAPPPAQGIASGAPAAPPHAPAPATPPGERYGPPPPPAPPWHGAQPRDPRTGGATGYALGGVEVPPAPGQELPTRRAHAPRPEDRTEEVPQPPPPPPPSAPPAPVDAPAGPPAPEDAVPQQRPEVRHLGDRAPTYAAEPGPLPPADPAALDALVPDTVLEGARYGAHTLRAASLRGDSARYRGENRRDFLLTARFGSGDDALVLVALAGGDRAAPGAAEAAAELCRTVAAAVGRSQGRLADDIRAGRRDALRSGLQRLTDRGYGRLRARAAELGLAEEEYTAGLRGLLLPVDPECRTRVCFGSGAGGLFRLRSGQWQDLEPTGPAAPGPAPAADADERADAVGEPGSVFRFRASVGRPGDTLLLCTGGLAEPMREEAALREELAARWAEPEPPGLAAFLADTQLRLKGYADDRTAAAVWEA
ncbi:protein phosphatase 2C domain-containing protein [Streptomyces erythrochromogenes]|uniref:protein phosphatase 2C domain-containing protein n=1 Tax=Streptomyces erythrochromogenes TaxID=285574 RepID=UPI0036B56D1B